VKVLLSVHSDVKAWTLPTAQVHRLRARFPHIEFAHATTDEEAIAEAVDAEVALAGTFGPELLGGANRLRWIHSPAAGVGNMLHEAMLTRSIVITNSRGIHAESIAEHVIAVVFALCRKVHVAVRRQVEHTWAQDEIAGAPPLRRVAGSRMGVIGLGQIGTAIAKRAAGAGMDVAGIRRRPDLPHPDCIDRVYGPSQLPDLLAQSDFVVLAVPLTSATRELIGSRELRLMKRSAFLVNVGRGKLVVEPDLVDALRAHTIAGAALDVVEHEPLDPASPLWDLPNVLLTPHTSGFRPDYWDAVVDLFADNLTRYLERRELLNVVDKQAGY
jgi:phosphoglycerate dehydrogenase-like enzyme